MINSINICDLVEILNIRISNTILIRDKYKDFSDDDCFRARMKWDGISNRHGVGFWDVN